MTIKTSLLTTSLILISFLAFSQLENNEVITGGQKYKFSDKILNKNYNQRSRNHKIPLKNIKYTNCKKEYKYKEEVQIRINKQNNLEVSSYLKDNCGREESKFKVELVNDSTLNILHASKGISQRCFCFFKFELTLSSDLEKYDFDDIKFIQVNGINRPLVITPEQF